MKIGNESSFLIKWKMAPVVASVVFSATGSVMAMDVLVKEDQEYRVCVIDSLTHDGVSGVMRVNLSSDQQVPPEKDCLEFLNHQVYEGEGLKFIWDADGQNIVDTQCGFVQARFLADGTVLLNTGPGCLYDPDRQYREPTPFAYDCYEDDASGKAYVLNVEGYNGDFECSEGYQANKVIAGNVQVRGVDDEPVVIRFVSSGAEPEEAAIRIMPPFRVAPGSEFRAIISGI